MTPPQSRQSEQPNSPRRVTSKDEPAPDASTKAGCPRACPELAEGSRFWDLGYHVPQPAPYITSVADSKASPERSRREPAVVLASLPSYGYGRINGTQMGASAPGGFRFGVPGNGSCRRCISFRSSIRKRFAENYLPSAHNELRSRQAKMTSGVRGSKQVERQQESSGSPPVLTQKVPPLPPLLSCETV